MHHDHPGREYPITSNGWDILDEDFVIDELPLQGRFLNRPSIIHPGYSRLSNTAVRAQRSPKKRPADDGVPGAARNHGGYAWKFDPPHRAPSPLTFENVLRMSVAGAIAVILAIAAIIAQVNAPEPVALPSPSPHMGPTGEAAPGRMTAEEAAQVTLTDWQLLRHDDLGLFVLTFTAPDLDRAVARGRLDVTVTTDDGVSHELTGHLALMAGGPSVASVPAMLGDSVITDLQATFRPTIAYDTLPEYDLAVADVAITTTASVVDATGSLATSLDSDGSPGSVTVQVIVRDSEGSIQNFGSWTVRTADPGKATPFRLRMFTSHLPTGTDTITTLLTYD